MGPTKMEGSWSERPSDCFMTRDAYLLAQASLAAALPEKTHEIKGNSEEPLRVGKGLDGHFTNETGFIPPHHLEVHLPVQFEPWERVHDRLPQILRQGIACSEIDQLPALDEEFSTMPECYLARAGLVLSALAHAYFFGHREESDLRLPDHVERAWVLVSDRQGRPFAGRVVADDILNNVRTSSEPYHLSSTYFDLPEERLSSGLQGFMERTFAPALALMTEAHKHLAARNDEAIAACLEQISNHIVECAMIFLDITPQAAKRGFDPIIWIKSYPAMGNPVRDGELGNSGVDAPLFHALDAFLERAPQSGDLRGMQKDRRGTFPAPVRAFIEALGDPLMSIRDYVSKSSSKRLTNAFDGTLQIYAWFLERHRVKAVGVTGVSLGSGRHTTSSGVKQDAPKKAAPLPPDQMLSRQMKAGIASRMGARNSHLIAVVENVQSGPRADIISLAISSRLPLQAGDRVHVWPENSSEKIEAAVHKIKGGFDVEESLLAKLSEQLKRRDLQQLEKAIVQHCWSVETCIDALPLLEPRFYSIGDVTFSQGTTHLSLTVGHGTGVSTTYFSQLQYGYELQVRPMPSPRFRLPQLISTPLLLVGQGSGIGPLVGFLLARSRSSETSEMGEMMLVAGARCRDDVPHWREMLDLTAKLPLTIYLALTQEHMGRIVGGRYITITGKSARAPAVLQTRLHAIEKLLGGNGQVFVCGSTQFGVSVRKALGKYPRETAPPSHREYTPPAPSDWKRYHEDLFGYQSQDLSEPVTSTELSKHNSFDDLWLAIDGIVYDVTKFAGIHPGGVKVLMEGAGTVADRRFFETHGGPHLQEIKGQMGPYAVGGLASDDRLDEQSRKLLDTTVRIQNALTNNTAFPEDRDVPFYAYADALIVFAEVGLDQWRTALGDADSDAVADAQSILRDAFLALRTQSRKKLAATDAHTLHDVEEEVKLEYLKHASVLHSALDEVKEAIRRGV